MYEIKKVLRCGSWDDGGRDGARLGDRAWNGPDGRYGGVGFRVMKAPGEPIAPANAYHMAVGGGFGNWIPKPKRTRSAYRSTADDVNEFIGFRVMRVPGARPIAPRMLHGAAWYNDQDSSRLSARPRDFPFSRDNGIGFRVMKTAEKGKWITS